MADGDEVRPIRVLVVDDHTLLRDGVTRILNAEPDMVVVGEGGDGEAAVRRAADLQPDVVLLDAELPRPEVTIPRIRQVCPPARVVMLSGRTDPVVAAALMALGPRGFLVKDVSAEQLTAAVRTVMREDRTVAASSGAGLNEALDQLTHLDEEAGLTARERDVLELAARDLSNQQIADSLHMSEATVRRHLHSAAQKLQAGTRLGAVLRAVLAGLISPTSLIYEVDLPSPMPSSGTEQDTRLLDNGQRRSRW